MNQRQRGRVATRAPGPQEGLRAGPPRARDARHKRTSGNSKYGTEALARSRPPWYPGARSCPRPPALLFWAVPRGAARPPIGIHAPHKHAHGYHLACQKAGFGRRWWRTAQGTRGRTAVVDDAYTPWSAESAARLEHLVAVIHPRSRAPFTDAEIVELMAAKHAVEATASQVAQLRAGAIPHARAALVAGLARLFGVPEAYFHDEVLAALVDEQLEELRALVELEAMGVRTNFFCSRGGRRPTYREVLAMISNATDITDLSGMFKSDSDERLPHSGRKPARGLRSALGLRRRASPRDAEGDSLEAAGDRAGA